MKKNTKTVKVTFLGGVGEVGKNMTAIECGDDMIIVDCGVSFATSEEAPGIDAIIPDITYVKENISKLRGIVLTHGHEDHIGAIPYYADDLKDVPIYGTALTIGLLKRKLDKNGKKCNLVVVSAGDTVTLGGFKVEFIKVCHSMAGACALAITTQVGTVFVTGDFKIDNTPIDGKKTDIGRIAEIGAKGVLLMLGESTNVERKGSSTSEKVVGQTLENIFASNLDKRIVIACFASSNYRVQQVLTLAHKYHRKVVLAGRSMKGMAEVASACGELQVPKGVIVDSVGKLLPSETVILATGSQGEPLSALNKLSKGEFNKINIGPQDLVVLSSSPIPGNEKLVNKVINELMKRGANVVYERMYDVHVSGHACQEELKLMMSIIKPKYFIPLHGEQMHLVKHAGLARQMGIPEDNILIASNGSVIEVSDKALKSTETVQAGRVLVDGLGVGDVGNVVLRDRKHLSQDGLIIVVVGVSKETGQVTSGPELISRGFVYVRENEDIIEGIRNTVRNIIASYGRIEGSDWPSIKNRIKDELHRYIYDKIKRNPMILPIIVDLG